VLAVAREPIQRPQWVVSLYPEAGEAGGTLSTLAPAPAGGTGRGDPERAREEAARRARTRAPVLRGKPAQPAGDFDLRRRRLSRPAPSPRRCRSVLPGPRAPLAVADYTDDSLPAEVCELVPTDEQLDTAVAATFTATAALDAGTAPTGGTRFIGPSAPPAEHGLSGSPGPAGS